MPHYHPHPILGGLSPVAVIPPNFVEGGPVSCAVESADQILIRHGVALPRELVIGVAVAAIVEFAFAGGLEDDQIAALRKIIAKASVIASEGTGR